MVNTEHLSSQALIRTNYNILNIVVNTERAHMATRQHRYYNILNIVVNTERWNWNWYC